MGSPVYLEVVKLSRYQHYKDRCPPWIKLHSSVMDDYEFCSLDDKGKWHLAAIWLLASRTDNRIPNDPAFLKTRLGLTHKPDLDGLISLGFLAICDDCKQAATDMLASCPSEERRGEGETEERESARKRACALPIDFELSDEMKTYADGKGISGGSIPVLFEQFTEYHRGQGTTRMDWVATWRTWVMKAIEFDSIPKALKKTAPVARDQNGKPSIRDTGFDQIEWPKGFVARVSSNGNGLRNAGKEVARDRLSDWHQEFGGEPLDGLKMVAALAEIGIGESTTEAR